MKNQHEKRQKSICKLKEMMNYPGRFPILVIGDTGVGKTHWIFKLIKEANEFKKKQVIAYAGLIESTEEYWENLLKKSDKHFLIIEEVEKLTEKSQEILFEALSTTNGLYGFKQKEYEIRIIFTSTFPIRKIRDDRRYLMAKFFDRISQFVVEFPNFDETQTSIYEDFKATWLKFFEKVEKFKDAFPKSDNFRKWIERGAYRMHGNFRDLDKIAINWNLHQLDKNNDDEKILNKIKEDFKKSLHNPSQKIYEDNTFVFNEDTNYGDMLNDFKAKLKKWALALNNNEKRKASKMLGISYRTIERW
ncbi:MAG: ATP-binding protein [Bacteroidales bacterium]|nr:ATP-binding protein [Bacteroidales bacterium]